ncbi:hypothetical protein FACUT_9041 [Fusarium acutatum]|uniref:Uncharacterized protein n=1 Tax=Fusarium acutatum TaxID=78861 RepID=A0A8H4JIY1_9HYPO|nr:hypothetical protein FACUT_9041 [Fusarium acutatum]
MQVKQAIIAGGVRTTGCPTNNHTSNHTSYPPDQCIQQYRLTRQYNHTKMPRLKKFENKREILAEIRITETSIETVTQLIKNENWEATVESTKRLGAGCIVASGPMEYDNTRKAMAQQQCDEYWDKEQCALKRKERRERELKELKKRLEQLQGFRDKWQGAD